ncbi:uncharacterized protein LOC117343854 [Pecten maximus]|uniref:uncharacterized protein LOC117343854 n=1 Tax=Pecten maximus TaxID=6579 RepID=UPI0014588B08|nr:uncharacterized protein LOC117343854 [Pecten maximus]
MEHAILKCRIAAKNETRVRSRKESEMDEFKKDGDPSKVMDMMKKIQENNFKGKSKRSITIKDRKSDLKDVCNVEEKSDGTEKETSEEKSLPGENEEIIPEQNDSFRKDMTHDIKKWKKGRHDQKNDYRKNLSDGAQQTPAFQDNRFASTGRFHGDVTMEEEETPVKELMHFPMENEHAFESMQSNCSMFSMDFRTEKIEGNWRKDDGDKDDNKMEKTDEAKPEKSFVDDVDLLSSESLGCESLLGKQLHVDSLNEEDQIPPVEFNSDKDCTANLHSADFDNISELLKEDIDRDVDSSLSMDKNGKLTLDKLDSLSSEYLEVNLEKEFELLNGCQDGNRQTNLQFSDSDTLLEKEQFVEKEMDLKLQEETEVSGENVCIEDESNITEYELEVDLESFSQKSSKQLSKCGRDLKDITNSLLMMTDRTSHQCTKGLDRATAVPLLKGDSLDTQLSDLGELKEMTSQWLVTLSDLLMEKEQLDLGLDTLADLQSKVSQGLEVQSRERRNMKKKVKQLKVLCLEMLDSKTLDKPANRIIPPGITTNKKFLRMVVAIEKLPWTNGRQLHRHCSVLPPSGHWTSQGVRYKGDNLKKQPTDSGSGRHGNGHQGNWGNQKSSKDGNGNKGGDKENTRNFEDEKDIDEQEHPPEENNNETSSAESPSDTMAPLPNHKSRKKDDSEEEKKMKTFNMLAALKEDIPPDIMKEIGKCLVACLNSRKIGGSDVISDCSICAFLFSLISHFGNCPSDYNSCDMCQRAFCLVSKHLQLCMECQITETEPICPLPICQKIKHKFKKHPEKISRRGKELWPKLKKYLARFSRGSEDVGLDMPVDEGDDYFSLTSIPLSSLSSLGSSTGGLPLSRPPRTSRTSVIFQPNLESISENTITGRPTGSRSEPLARRTETGEIIYQRPGIRQNRPSRLSFTEENRSPYSNQSKSAPLVKKTEDGKTVFEQDVEALPKPLRPDRKVSFSTTKSEVFSTRSLPSPEEKLESLVENAQYTSLNAEKVYGDDRTSSLPLNFFPPENAGDQLTSVQMRPMGYPGIGEVVYAPKDHLRYVARHWKKVKEDYGRNKTAEKKHLREEGVVLTENKEKFSIFRTRYQKNFQWIRLTHLGTGMSGKCHLAQDYNTDFKFCIKKIHILKFEERELDIWSDLSHQNIVQLYGAIRHGHNIYIFEEFIDGGCLTETINLQKETGHRLSHWTALNYLQQILQVLVYLERRSIIHEDIKADNILLRKDTTQVVVSDFGVARRLEHVLREASPVGTPTSFSPEKAQGQGHGARSDVWAAVCTLIHMLSGWPPWVRRYEGVATLNFIIVEREPPLKDLPANVSRDVYNLVEHALKKDPKVRPSASKLLQHEAFKLLTGTPETFVSVLESPLNTNINISDDLDKALIEKFKDQYQPSNVLPCAGTMTPNSTESPQGSCMAGNEILTSVGRVTPCDPPNILPEAMFPILRDVTVLGVMGPPSPAKYIETDPFVFLRRYVDDSDVSTENFEQKFKNLLEHYKPEPDKESDSGEDDIEKTLSVFDRGFVNIPDLEMLLENAMQDHGTQGRASIPDVVHQMHDEALRQNMKETSGEVINRTSEQLQTSYGYPTEQEREEMEGTQFQETDPNDIPNFGTLLGENQPSHNINSNLPTVLFSLEDIPTITGQELSSGGNSLKEGSESSEEQRLWDSRKSSTERSRFSEEEGSLKEILSFPKDTSPSGVPYCQNPPLNVMPDLEALMASIALIQNENSSIPMDDLFCSGDEETPESPNKGKGQSQCSW